LKDAGHGAIALDVARIIGIRSRLRRRAGEDSDDSGLIQVRGFENHFAIRLADRGRIKKVDSVLVGNRGRLSQTTGPEAGGGEEAPNTSLDGSMLWGRLVLRRIHTGLSFKIGETPRVRRLKELLAPAGLLTRF
jgi:hypothetical protein